jgi:hypothetical protein
MTHPPEFPALVAANRGETWREMSSEASYFSKPTQLAQIKKLMNQKSFN